MITEFGPDEAPRPDLRAILDGEIVVIRSGLQRLGVFDRLNDTILAQVGAKIGTEAQAMLRQRGLEKLHEAVPASELKMLLAALTDILRPFAAEIICNFSRCFAPETTNLYGPDHLWVRMMTPAHITQERPGEFDAYPGHLVVHRPHRDSWFSHCHNSVNLWAAVGPVRPDNGVLLYPAAYRMDIPRDGLSVRSDQWLGRPVGFTLDPGDIVCFAGEQVHSSAMNVTEETRVAVSARLSLGPPKYGHGTGWIAYVSEAALSGRAPLSGSLPARANMAYLRHLHRRLKRRLAPVRPHDIGADPAATAALREARGEISRQLADLARAILTDEGAPECLDDLAALAQAAGLRMQTRVVRPQELSGDVVAASQSSCFVRMGSQLGVVARHCPHMGADLAVNGALTREGQLECAWHAVRFAMTDGRANCVPLAALTVRPFRWYGDTIAWLEEDTT